MTQMHGHYRNGFHQRIEDEYEDEYEDYEDEGLEGEENDEQKEVEERKPNKEELEFLKLREERKEKYRQKLKKQSAKAFGHSIQSQDSKRTSTNDKFGSFFGPSQPVIASRVLDESRSIRETQHIISKPPSSSGNERISASASSERKLHEHHQRPKVNEVKRKAQTLKDTRDYSFLLSDDADFPDHKEPQPASRHVSAPKPDARSTQAPLKSKIPISRPLQSSSNGHELKNAVPTSRQIQTKVPMKGTHVSRPLPFPSSSEPRKIPSSNAGGNGPSRPAVPKPLPKMPSKVSVQSKVPVQVMGTNKPSSKAMNGLSLQKNISMEKPHSSTQNHYAKQERASQVADRVRLGPKLAPPSLKSQPPKTIPPQNIREESLKKKPVRRRPDEDDDAEADAIQMIRNMFGYNPSKYAGKDDDDSDMEAGFCQIEMEERRSSKIARAEDEEQLRLIQEEERRERMRKKHKPNRG